MPKNKLQIQQLDSKMQAFAVLQKLTIPPTGWVKGIRTALGMSLQQLGNKMSVTKQNVRMLEQREKEGTVSVNTLKEMAEALDMQLVYGLVPKDGSLENLIERKAIELAKQIVLRTSHSMKLEAQENSDERIKNAIQEKVASFKNELPKILWD